MRRLQQSIYILMISLATLCPNMAHAENLCDMPKSKVMNDIKRRLQDRYPTSDRLQQAQYQAALRDYEALCSNAASPRSRELLNDLTHRHYPAVSLIKSFYESLMDPPAAGL